MKRKHSSRIVDLGLAVLAQGFFALTLLYATASLAAVLYGMIHGLGWLADRSALRWLAISPLVYIAWLNTFLIACAIDIQVWRLLFRFEKPRRAATSDGFAGWLQFQLAVASYLRERVVWSLPLAEAYLVVPGLRCLVLLACAPRVSLGRDSAICGTVYDPDLTDIGDGVIVGAGSSVVAHTVTTTRDGARVLATAPIVIGPRAVIGGHAHINPGVRIGADALIEPVSYVAAFTVIGEGEVWGGNPARFLRHRFEPADAKQSPMQMLDTSDDEMAMRQVLSIALNWPIAEIHSDFHANDCSAWDSLGQLAIAAGLHDRFGLVVPAEMIFRLKSLSDLRTLILKPQAVLDETFDVPRPLGSGQREPLPNGRGTDVVRFNQCLANKHRAYNESPSIELPHDPELLPLLDHEQVTRALSHCESLPPRNETTARESVSVVVAATFVAEPLASTLKTWSRAFGVSVELRFAGFNQVQQCLMTPGSEFHQNTTGLNVVLARPEDLLSSGTDAEGSDVAESLLSAISSFAKVAPGTLVVATLPPVVSSFCSASRQQIEALRTRWSDRLSQIDGLRVLDFAELVERIGVTAAGRADLEVIARSPYTPRVFQELGIAMARLVRQQRVAPAKVLALDADGILWGGVLGEDGLTGIQLGPDHPGRSFQLFQTQVLELKRRGCLLVLVSRNDEADVWRVFDEHPEMVLRRRDITAARINWSPKSQNLKELAAELNLGLDSFVFIDDDPANHAEVSANAPGVTVVPMPNDPTLYCQTLSRLWRFDAPQLTVEDQNRAEMMHAEQKRRQQLEATIDLGSYLQSLRLRVSMRVAREAELPRVSQLTQKTNQFNTSLKRRSLAEVQALAPTHTIYVVEASDRFGDYGLVGVAVLARGSDQSAGIVLDTLLMSCRALGRGIEDAVLHGLAAAVTTDGGRQLLIPCIEGPRNQPCRDFLARTMSRSETNGEYECSDLAALTRPAHIDWHGPTILADRQAA